MSSVFNKLYDKKLIQAPPYLKDTVCYEVITGSIAYGCNNDTSDQDIYGFAIPPKDVVFPMNVWCIVTLSVNWCEKTETCS